MSNNRKNNHYHYAEKFDGRGRRRASGKRAFMPFKSVVISLVILLIFGFICTTFAAYVSDSEPEYESETHSLIAEARSIKASRDVALTGADADIAATGWSFGGGYIYFDNKTTNWSDTYIYLVIGKDSYSSVYSMTALAKTKYYYCALPTSGWGDATYMAVIGTSSSWGSGSWGSSNLTNATHRTAAYTSGLDASSGQRYIFTPSSSSNGCSLSLSNNDNLTTVTLTAHACYTTNGSSYTQDNKTGGTVNVKGYYMTNDTTVSTLSDAGAEATAEYLSVRTTATYKAQFVAAAATNYRFLGWYTAKTGGSLVSSGTTYNYDVNSGNKEIYARFIRTYSVSITKATASDTSGTFSGTPTFTYNSSDYTSANVDVGSSITLDSDNTNSGISCTFHISSATGTTITSPYTITAARSIYAVYSMTAPTISAFSYADSPTLVNASAIEPSKTVSKGASGTLSYAYSFISTGSTGSSDGYSLNTSTGAFSATIPGKYVIRLTVTETASGLSRTATSDTTISVKPAAPDASVLQYSVEGYTDDYTAGTTGKTYSLPIKAPINSSQFKITAWLSNTTEGYKYDWSNVTGTYNPSNGSITAISGATTKTVSDDYRIIDLCTDSGSALRVGSDGNYAYQISVTATYNEVTSDPTTMVLYYDVISDFLDIQYMSFTANTNEYQKIYAVSNEVTQILSSIRAGGTTFNTISWFSPDNMNYRVSELWGANFPFTNSFGTFNAPVPDDAAHRTSALQTTFDVSSYMPFAGPKWFRVYMNDTGNNKTASATRYIHTTVGTQSASADRPIYYVDNTGNSYTKCRVMAFYVLDGETSVHYQTAQATSTSGRYRFYIPSDTRNIIFAHVYEDSYVLPTFANSTFSMSAGSEYLKAWTESVDLFDSSNIGKNLYTANSSTTASGINYYTGTMSVLN